MTTGKKKKKGGFFGVSLGVGHPMNVTVFALRVLNGVGTIFVPGSGKGRESQALSRLKRMPVHLEDKNVVELFMPMEKEGVEPHWAEAAATVRQTLDAGADAAFAGIGDMLQYGTFHYIERLLREEGYQTLYLPGVTSYQTLAAAAGVPLMQGDESLLVLPGDNVSVDELAERDTIVFMKRPRNKALFKKLSSSHRLYLGVNIGMDGERTGEIDNVEKDLAKLPYFSLVMAKKKQPR